MSDWEKLAAEIEEIVDGSVKGLVEGASTKYKEGLKELAQDVAKAKLRTRKGSDDERALAREDLQFLYGSLQSRAAEMSLEMSEAGADTFKRVIGAVVKTLLVAAKL